MKTKIVSCLMAFTFAASAAPALAAQGLAWDQVTKLAQGEATVAPGTFASDFATASQQKMPAPARGGLFGAINSAISMGTGMAAMLQNGTAEREYVAGNLRRTDDLAMNSATITDCPARTVTRLNLADKTYRVTSLDDPRPPTRGTEAARGGPPRSNDDGSKTLIAMTNSGLGPLTIDGTPSTGYRSQVVVTTTKPSGEAATFNTTTTQYLSNTNEPTTTCFSRGGNGMPRSAGPMAQMGEMQMMTQAMRMRNDPRFVVTSTGATMPVGRFVLFQTTTLGGGDGRSNGGSFTMITERGNVRAISDTDQTIFAVPSDFTKVQ